MMNKEAKNKTAFGYGAGASIVCAFMLMALLTGCGHNTVSYGDGIMLETTLDPESCAFGISFRYGKILTACLRENAELEMQGAGSGSAGAGEGGGSSGANSSGSVKLKIGRQITGYCVDALKAGAKPEELVKYTDRE